MHEIFKTVRAFNKKFPLKIYTCPICGEITNDPHKCGKCAAQSNNFVFGGEMYEYEIVETGETDKIFPPADGMLIFDIALPPSPLAGEGRGEG